MNIKQEARIRIQQMNEKKYSLKSNFFWSNRLFVLVYSNQDDNSKRFKTGIYYLRKGIIIIYNITIYGKKIMTNPLIQI